MLWLTGLDYENGKYQLSATFSGPAMKLILFCQGVSAAHVAHWVLCCQAVEGECTPAQAWWAHSNIPPTPAREIKTKSNLA